MERCQACGAENPEGFRFCGSCGAELVAAPAPREVRKTVTVVFCDVTGSTAMGERLDPESTRRVMSLYFDAMREAIERHGGTVEKFIGDAVMAVFGIPVVHEDDALRAVRAAADMREALGRLNDELECDWGVRIESRIGVNTGEVVTGEGETLAVGDAVNVAARLEQAAAPGETLLGETTYRLVREAVVAQPVDPVAAKGKSEPLSAWAVHALVEGAEFIPRRLDSPLVGRENELAQLQRAFDHAVSERVAYQFTLLGTAGIGKSRLVRELADRVDAVLLSGRCLPYGDGITYWPLTEIEPVAAELDFGATRDEIALQTRRILERLARERPLVVVFEDLQWAEPTFLDLVDHVTDLARDAPMLLLCVARPELLDARPGWSGGKLNATTMLLEALSRDQSAQLVESILRSRLDTDVKERVAAAAAGNPLYVEEMLAVLAEHGNGELTIPPTIQALLAARLDGLAPEERTVVECAAVQGQEFAHEALATLLPEPSAARLTETLQSLVRKDLVRPATDETFSFKHLLLRDAAYEGLPKEQRADLHERFAGRVHESNPRLREIIAYHLEQAYRYRSELGPVDEDAQQLARRAATLLADAGRRANDRGDVHATINLLERSVALLPPESPEALELYPDLGNAVGEAGDLEREARLYEVAEASPDEGTALRARMQRIWLEVRRGGPQSYGLKELEPLLASAERIGDDALIADALSRLGVLAMWTNDIEGSTALLRRSVEHAEAAGDLRSRSFALHWLGLNLLWGTTPVDEALAECRRLLDLTAGHEASRPELLVVQGALLALAGQLDEGRALAAEGREALLELGQSTQYAGISMPVAFIELQAGDNEEAERILRDAHRTLSAAGEHGYLSTVSALLGLALVQQGRYEEAEAMADEARELGAADDAVTQIYWRVVKARVVGETGSADEAARLAAETADLVVRYKSFDGPIALVEVARYLEPARHRQALDDALSLAEAKGDVVTAEKARQLLAALP